MDDIVKEGKVPFCVVWSPQGGNPITKHPNITAAVDEATRLATKNPGREFYVMAAVARTRIKSVEIEWFGERVFKLGPEGIHLQSEPGISVAKTPGACAGV